jgi:succinate-semialdehyde dehydrogenase/glutarate-semialdehyde dehydrogenase
MVQGVAIVDNCLVNTNPATGQVISKVPCTLPDELDVMIQRSVQAQLAWSQTPVETRVQILRNGLEALSKHEKELAAMIVSEMGKPLAQAVEEVDFAVHKKDYLDLLQTSLLPKQFGSSVVVRQALGVVAVLSPWNFPADEILLLMLPALGSGNTVILKPSEVAPETGKMVFEALASVLPESVLQLAQGDGAVGSHLVGHSSVNMIAMTGSTATGTKIIQAAAPKLKRLVLELGGKDPMVVFGDADLDKAAKDAVEYSLSNTGQVCCSIERIYVDESVYDDFQQRVALCAANYKVGNGMDPGVNVGPLVSATQRDKVKEHVEDALQKGAKLLHQSDVPASDASQETCFYPVTVLADVSENMQMYREETFGPVVALTPFDGSEETAIRLANDTEYGLASCVYTQDLEKARRVASRIHAGQVGINCYALENMSVFCPWVGHKMSGFGFHSGEEGFYNFSVPKSIIYTPEESP